jgi:hypothetical protein
VSKILSIAIGSQKNWIPLPFNSAEIAANAIGEVIEINE